MKGRAILAVLIVIGASAAGALTWKLHRPASGTSSAETASDLARDACSDGDRFIALVKRDASVDDVNAALGAATEKAAKAAALDPHWVGLQSALQTLRLSLDRNDAGTANVGMRVLRAQCVVFK